MQTNPTIFTLLGSKDAISRSLIAKHLLAVAILLALSLGIWIVISGTLKTMKDSAELINTSGKQRMLTVKLMHIADHFREDDGEKIRKMLDESKKQLLDGLNMLYGAYNDKNSLSFGDSGVKNRLDNSKVLLDAFLAELEKKERTPYSSHAQGEALLDSFEKLTTYYQYVGQSSIKRLQNIELFMLFLSVLVILAEAFFIFRPALISVFKRHNELLAVNESLLAKVEEEVAKRREKEELLMQQSKLASMGEMISNIAHQWRQPLNAIGLIFSKMELARENSRLDDRMLVESFQKGETLLEQMSQTIDDFRNFFQPNKQRKEFVLQKSIQDAINLVLPALEHANIAITTKMSKDEVVLFGFPNELSQVLLNIISNSKDALLENRVNGAFIKIDLTKDEKSVHLKVADNGGGIPDAILPRIFEPYYTTKEQGKGTGIGLYMSRHIIEGSMGGELFVKNIENGALFEIVIPLKASDAE